MPDFPKAFSKEDRKVLWKQSKYGVWGFRIAILSLAISIAALVISIIY